MAKRPQKGKVKTRLTATLGEDKALRIYNGLLQHTLDQVAGLDGAVYWTGEGIIPTNALAMREQIGADLGQRMLNAIRQEQNDRSGVVVIGTDCPGFNRELMLLAMDLLDRNEVVLGPTLDGGYYLIGMRCAHEELFHDIPWSTDKVFELTLAACRRFGWSVATLPMCADIDTEDDLLQQLHDWPWLRDLLA